MSLNVSGVSSVGTRTSLKTTLNHQPVRFAARRNRDDEPRSGFWDFLNNHILTILLFGGGILALGVKGCTDIANNAINKPAATKPAEK